MSIKYRLLLWLILTVSASVDSQDVPQFIKEIEGSLQNNIPTDKIFLQTDRNLYFPGDTLYFQSYIANRFTGEFKTNSHSLWVLLTDREGQTIDSARFRVGFSQAPGWLVIPDRCKPGICHLYAFTSMMQNYDPSWVWSMRVKVEDTAREKVAYEFQFDKTSYSSNDTVELSMQLKNSDGDVLKNTAFSYGKVINNKTESVYRAKTTGEGKALMRIYLPDSLDKKEVYLLISLDENLGEKSIEIPRHSEMPVISFLPESGHLVPGYKNRMAFNAFSQDGRQLFLNGVIMDEQGNIVDSVHSGALGPGLAEFVPVAGENYHAEYDKYPEKRFYLPEVTDDQLSLRINREEGCLSVDIMGDCYGETLYLALIKNYKIKALAQLEQDNKQKRVKFLTDSLLPGMARIALFDSMLRPLAERCIFIPRAGASGISINPEFKYFLTAQEADLQVEITNDELSNVSGIFSLAIVDSSNALSPDLVLRNIEDEFLFEKDFYDRIPFLIKNKGLCELDEEELDLILLTYGWSRYKEDNTEEKDKYPIVDYDNFNILISYLQSFARRKNKNPGRKPVFILAPGEQMIIDLVWSGNNSLVLKPDSLPLTVDRIMIIPDRSVANKIEARLKPVVNHSYFKDIRKQEDQAGMYFSEIEKKTGDQTPDIDSINVIKEIDVYASRTPAKKFVNEYEEKYQNLSTRTLDGLAIETFMNFEDMLRRLNPMRLNAAEKTIHFSPTGRIGGEPPPALFVLDGIPQETNYNYLMDLKPESIHSVTALIGVSGFFIYGEEAIGGVVFIETKLNNQGSLTYNNEVSLVRVGDLGKIIQMYRARREFYNPPKAVIENDPKYWIRPTLYWNPEVFYDGRKPVKVKYVNHRRKGTVFIIANGVTVEGEPVYGVSKYQIK